MQVLFNTTRLVWSTSLVWYDSGARAQVRLPRGQARRSSLWGKGMTKPRHAETLLLGAFALLLAVADVRLARSEDQTPAAAAPAHSNCQPSAFRVVVDVGHTVDVPGALSARGMPEYAFNLQLAQQIKQTLVDAGFDKTVLLITAKAPPVGLFERAIIANRLPADLFISIHHDSVPDNLLQTWQYEGAGPAVQRRLSGLCAVHLQRQCRPRRQPAVRQLLGQGAAGARPAVHAALHAGADGTSPARTARRRCRRLPLRPVGRAADTAHAGAAARSRLDRQPAGRTGTRRRRSAARSPAKPSPPPSRISARRGRIRKSSSR